MAKIVFTEEDNKLIDEICDRYDPAETLKPFTDKMPASEAQFALNHIRRMIRDKATAIVAGQALEHLWFKSAVDAYYVFMALQESFPPSSRDEADDRFSDAHKYLGEEAGGPSDDFTDSWAELLDKAEKAAIQGGRTLQSV